MSQGAWGVQLRHDVGECSSNNQRGQNRTGQEILKGCNYAPTNATVCLVEVLIVILGAVTWRLTLCVGLRWVPVKYTIGLVAYVTGPVLVLYSHCPYPVLQTSSLFPHKSLVLCFNLKRPRCHTARNSSKEGFARVRKTQTVISTAMESKPSTYIWYYMCMPIIIIICVGALCSHMRRHMLHL